MWSVDGGDGCKEGLCVMTTRSIYPNHVTWPARGFEMHGASNRHERLAQRDVYSS